MCAPRFIGEGYSDAFCKNMRAVSEKMKSGDYTLVDTCDDICAACPNNKGGVCADEVKVKGYDKAVKNALADGKTPHQSVVMAMDAIGQLGFSRLSIATVPPEQGSQ